MKLKELFQLEDAIEGAVTTWWRLAREVQVDILDSNAQLVTPRLEVIMQLGAATGHYAIYKGKAVHDAWDGILIFRVVTNRKKNGELHKSVIGCVRYLVQPIAGKFNLTNLPYHTLSVVSEAGTILKVEDELGQDISELHIKVKVSIRSDAWASVDC